MAVISGILKDPIGGPRIGVVIELRAVRTSATVVNQARSQSITDATGRYTLTVEPGAYDVLVTAGGRQPERVGSITVTLTSTAGTLNDFLTMPGETDITPEIVATVDRMRAEAAGSAAAAKTSETNAAAAMSNALSKVATADQSVASTVLLTKPVRLSSAASVTGFIPTSQGAWVSWNRKTATDDAVTGGTDFINHKGTLNGGWHFWSTDGTTINLSTRINWDGSIKTMGGITSYTDQIMQAGTTTANLLLRFRDKDGVEKGAVYSQTDTGVMIIRWAGTTYTMQGRADGFVTLPKGTLFSTAQTPADIIALDAGNAPMAFRGSDVAGFTAPNNYSIGTWNGFSVVPTIGTGLSSGVEQGKPVFYVNARTGNTYALNGLYVGSIPVLKTGDYGFGGSYPIVVSDADTSVINQYFRYPSSTTGAPSTSTWAGIQGGYDSATRWAIAYSMGVSTVDMRVRCRSVTAWGAWVSVWHTGNTTVDANGFLKKASPIVKLFGDGQCELNDQSQGVTAERVSEGVYRVSGTLGFNSDAEWGGVDGGIEIPTDRNKLPLVWMDYEVDESGDLLIKTFHRANSTAPAFAQNKITGYKDGQPIDIPAGRWIDLRVEMPASDEPELVIEPEPIPTPEVKPDADQQPEAGTEQPAASEPGDTKED